ncbi:MAG: FHIPEP family type III secretion protein [Chloroflexi bacterium]|nr:FHIPEP family type III secretion protein [Chloroflexota bacterium]
MADDAKHPPLQLAVELSPRLLARAEGTAGLLDDARRSIATGVGDLMARLGVPGEPAVALSALAEGSSQSQFLRLSVGGAPCRYPDRLLARVYSFLTATPLQPPNLERIAGWLEGPAEAGEPSRLARFLETACPAILALDPACLLAREQLDAYLAALPDGSPSSALPPETLLEILRELLHLRLSLRDRERIGTIIHKSATAGSPPDEIAEALIVALRPEVVIVTLPPAGLQQLRALVPEESPFTLMRDGLYYELGMRYPDFRLVPDPDLPPHSFAVQINDVVGLPWAGLRAGEILVNKSVERLRLPGTDGVESQNPANDDEAALVTAEEKEGLEQAGMTTWDALGYLILCFSRELREASAALFDQNLAAELCYQLGEVFPALNEALSGRFGLAFITRVLRRLLAEQISIRNLRQIAELILSFDTIVADSRRLIIFDNRLPLPEPLSGPAEPEMMAAYVRTGMKELISHKMTRGQNTLPVLLLEPALEEALVEQSLDAEAIDRLLAAVREEMGGYSPGAADRPAILTDVGVRAHLARLLAPEFPDVPVLAYQELSPAMNLQALGRLVVNL